MVATSAKLTIFEGPDGSGKSTQAQRFVEATGARYVHFGPMPRVTKNLARMYVEAMLPALLGYQDVVFDRSWLSERPYGVAFRGGKLRVGSADIAMLERLAMRCGATVIMCDPGWEAVLFSYRRRKGDEYLETENQLRHVYDLYKLTETNLPMSTYDYTKQGDLHPGFQDILRMPRHWINVSSAGNAEGEVAVVGADFANHKDQDSFYQYPFVSFGGGGCSRWLTDHALPEAKLYWVNADQVRLDSHLERLLATGTLFIALGQKAENALADRHISFQSCPHPQSWKRFKNQDAYPLPNLIRSLL